jgi:hypothetical protein
VSPGPTGTDPKNSRRADMLPIEKGVPRPERGRIRRNVIKNTLLALSAGDSFVVKPTSVSTVYARAKELGIKVEIYELDDKSGSRVWRMT